MRPAAFIIRSCLLVTLSLTLCPLLQARDFRYGWTRVRMDSAYDSDKVYAVDSIVATHQAMMEPLMEVIAHADAEIRVYYPESPLSDLAADMLIYAAGDYLADKDKVVSLTNFGGIRNDLPAGAIRVYDVVSVFPFENRIVIIDVYGRDLWEMIEEFADDEKFEVLGGVRLLAEGDDLIWCTVDGEPLDPDAVYKLVTVDFLYDGGDGIEIGRNALAVEKTGILMRDAAVEYMRYLDSQGIVLTDRTEGRIMIENDD